ncbi:abortive infection family protein [Methylobacterium sp. P31]
MSDRDRENLPLPEKKDLGSLSRAVREPLSPNAAPDNLLVEISNDMRTILGCLSTIERGVGALRTHVGGAHGRKRGHPKINGRAARLVLHAASAAALLQWGRLGAAHRAQVAVASLKVGRPAFSLRSAPRSRTPPVGPWFGSPIHVVEPQP